MSKDTKGITVSKDKDFSEWYTQVIQKADLADYTAVSGCIVYKPNSYALWEKIRENVDLKFKKIGIQNCYFPMFIPESLLKKEAAHIAGFAPEVAWVTHAGNTKLGERLAVRPTSETIMYDSYSKWIRSHRDLPLRLNQWNNVVRWEFKHPTPFLRGREFLWNEGHTCFATKKEAESEGEEIIGIYNDVCEKVLALPALTGKKSEQEKFAGAEYTISLEFMMPNGKAIQGPDFHHDGQIFAKAFDIKYTDDTGKSQFVWQNTFAITTRMLGVLIGVHGDDKGLVLPPKIAPTQVVIVPILFDDSRKEVSAAASEIAIKLEGLGVRVNLDSREGYSPGWKFNEWEMKGIPLRIEVGPRDLAKQEVIIYRRDTSQKIAVSITKLEERVPDLIEKMQNELYIKAKKMLKSSIVDVTNLAGAEKAIKSNKLIFAPWCGKCEEGFKETGAKSLNSPLKQSKITSKCFACSKKASSKFYFGKSY
jgi:prolyl-tRNA synthetase